jgi:predicted nucleic acid-binding protein
MNIIAIDTNIIISPLIKEGLIRRILTSLKLNFLFPEWGIEEIYFYKSEIMNKANINEEEFDILSLRILKYVRLVPTKMVDSFKEEADNLIGKIHINDVIFLATALAFNCPIWSDDKHFKKQKIVRIYNTKELLYLLR